MASPRPPVLVAIDFDKYGVPMPSRDLRFRGGLTHFIGFARLVGALRESRTVRDNENVDRFEIAEDGISIVLSTKPPVPGARKRVPRKRRV